jgi:hypothetical protein
MTFREILASLGAALIIYLLICAPGLLTSTDSMIHLPQTQQSLR